MANYGKVDIWGVDMTMGAQVDIASRWNAKFSAAATWQQALDKTNTTSQTYNSMLPYTPKWSGNGSIVLSTPWLNIGYSVIMQGSRYSSAQNKLEYRMNAFWEHSLTLNREFQLKSFRLNLQAKVTNLTDQQYEIIQYYPMPGRQFTFSGTFYF
jgi:outer membrane cobalamin receptor